MGSRVEVRLPHEHVRLLAGVEQRIRALERRWTRFRADSEISQLNNAAGNPVVVSPETVRLLATASTAYRLSEGLFDPRVLAALETAGYDRSHELLTVDPNPVGTNPGPSTDVPRPELVAAIDSKSGLVQIPAGDRWDLGGLGKGLACDILTEELWDLGVRGALVNLGGDMRMHGDSPDEPCWTVELEDPFDPSSVLGEIHLTSGAVATSSRARRRWIHESESMHHLIDPRTQRPAETDVVAVSVVAESAWWAEVLAKAALIAGRTEGLGMLARSGCSAALIDTDRQVTTIGEHIRLRARS